MKTRQICFFFISFMPVLKVFAMPSALVRNCGRDLLFVYALSFSLDFLVLQAILFTAKRKKDLYDQLLPNVKTAPTKIIYLLYALFFIIKCLYYASEQRVYIELSLYQTETHLLTFLPFFLFGFYVSTKRIKAIARLSDVTAVLSALSVIILILLSFSSGNYLTFMPLLRTGTKPFFKGLSASLLWGGDAVYLLFVSKDLTFEKTARLKINLSYLFSGILVMLFLAVFYAIFGDLGQEKIFAFAEISAYSVFLSNTARFDYFAIFLLLASSVVASTLPLLFATVCLKRVFTFKRDFIVALIPVSIVFVFITVFNDKSHVLLDTVYLFFPFVAIAFNYLLPTLSVFLKVKK